MPSDEALVREYFGADRAANFFSALVFAFDEVVGARASNALTVHGLYRQGDGCGGFLDIYLETICDIRRIQK